MTLQRYAVGEPWPHPLAGEGLQMVADLGEDGLSVLLVAAIARPTAQEVRRLTRERVRLGILPRPPLVFVVLAAEKLELDAPYALGLTGEADRAARIAAVERARGWAESHRGLLTLATVDAADQVTRGLRALSLSRAWWTALADALGRCLVVTVAERDQAMREAYTRYPTVLAMLRDCAIVEAGGAL